MNIFSLSFGKDSMATLILAAEQGIPIDRVLYVDIKFNDEISGEHPIMAEWIPAAEKRLKELFGITVDHAYSGIGYEAQFWKRYKRGTMQNMYYGFPRLLSPWCNSRLKVEAINKYFREVVGGGGYNTQFVGIAVDEPIRWERMEAKQTEKKKYRSLLVEQNLTEQDAMAICKKYDLLSPMYDVDGIFRGGCWFCPKQCMADLWSLWKNYPELYEKIQEMETFSYNTFKPNGITLSLLARRFENGYIPKRKVKSKFVQLDMFDKF